jgi:hypothetical protein
VDEPTDEGETSERVRCTRCLREVDESEAQAQRWGYWQVAFDLYPFCPECATRELEARQEP